MVIRREAREKAKTADKGAVQEVRAKEATKAYAGIAERWAIKLGNVRAIRR